MQAREPINDIKLQKNTFPKSNNLFDFFVLLCIIRVSLLFIIWGIEDDQNMGWVLFWFIWNLWRFLLSFALRILGGFFGGLKDLSLNIFVRKISKNSFFLLEALQYQKFMRFELELSNLLIKFLCLISTKIFSTS